MPIPPKNKTNSGSDFNSAFNQSLNGGNNSDNSDTDVQDKPDNSGSNGFTSAFNQSLKKKGTSSATPSNSNPPSSSQNGNVPRETNGQSFLGNNYGIPQQQDNNYVTTQGGVQFPLNNLPVPKDALPEIANNLQNKINAKTATPQDIQTLATGSGKNPLAVWSYVNEGATKGAAVENNQYVQDQQTKIKNYIQSFNSINGTQYNPDQVMSSADNLNNFLTVAKTKNVNAPTVQNPNYAATDATAVRTLPTNLKTPLPFDVSSDILNQVVQKTVSELPKEQAINKIASIINPKDYQQSQQIAKGGWGAKDYLTNTPTPLSVFKSNYQEQGELFNYQKGVAEQKYNDALRQNSVNQISQGTVSGDQNMVKEGQASLASVDNDVTDKYPALVKQQIAQQVNDYIAQKSGVVQGSDAQSFNDYKQKIFGSSTQDRLNAMQALGILSDPKKKDIAESMAGNSDYFANNSILGSSVPSFLQPFGDLGMSVADMAGLRSKSDILSDKIKDEMFPKDFSGNDPNDPNQLQLKSTVQATRTLVNTSFNLAGMLAISTATEGLSNATLGVKAGAELSDLSEAGKVANASKVSVGQKLGAYTSFGLPSFDASLKNAPESVTGEPEKYLYATINSIANAEGGRVLDLGKITRIPGVDDTFAKIANGLSNSSLSEAATKELLDGAKNKYIDFAMKYGTNVTKGAATMAYFNIANNVVKIAFGDQQAKQDLLPQAGHAFLDGLLGMSIMGGFGAAADMKNEKNTSFKGSIYNMALNHDAAADVFKMGLDNGTYTKPQYDEKMQILNTAISAKNALDATSADTGITLDAAQKSVYVANKTAQAVLENKAAQEGIPEETKNMYLQQAKRLAEQSTQTLDGLKFTPTLQPLYNLFDAEKNVNQARDNYNPSDKKSSDDLEAATQNYQKLYSDYLAGNSDESIKVKPTPKGEPTEVADTEILPTFEKVKSFIPEEKLDETQNIINKVNGAENVNVDDLNNAENNLYTALDKAPEAAHLIEPLILKLQNYPDEFKTKTETGTTTEKVPIEGTFAAKSPEKEIKSPLEHSIGSDATITTPDGNTATGKLNIKSGQYVLDVPNGGAQRVIGEKQMTDRDLSFGDENPIEMDENGNVKSVTVKIANGNSIKINDPEKALDIAIKLRAEVVGNIPDEAFDKAYQNVETEFKKEVPFENADLTNAKKLLEPMEKSPLFMGMPKPEDKLKYIAQQAQNISVDGKPIEVGDGKGNAERQFGKELTDAAVKVYPKEKLLSKESDQKEKESQTKKTEVKKENDKPFKSKVSNPKEFQNKYKDKLSKLFSGTKEADKSDIKTDNGKMPIDQYVSRAKDVLNKLFPKAKFETYDNHADFEKAGGIEGSRGTAITDKEGNKRILLNLQQMKEDGVGKTAFHEVIHPIVSEVFGKTPEELTPVWNSIVNEMKGVEGMGKVWDHLVFYGESKTPVEGITEFLTQVADGNISLDDIPQAKQNKLVDLINKLFEKLGINYKINSNLDLHNFAAEIKKSFETGDVEGLKKYTEKGNENKYDNVNADTNSDKQEFARNFTKDAIGEGYKNLKDIQDAASQMLGHESPELNKLIEDAYKKSNEDNGEGGKKPPIGKDEANGEGEDNTGTHINKDDITSAEDLATKFPISGDKVGWKESVKSALSKLAKTAKKGETLLDAGQRKISEWGIDIDKELSDTGKSTFNPNDEDLAVMSYVRTGLNEKLSSLNDAINSSDATERLQALNEAGDIQDKILSVDHVLSESGKVAGRSFYIRQAVGKMDAENNLQLRRMDIMRSQGNEPLSSDQESSIAKVVAEENKLRSDAEKNIPKFSQEDFDAKVKSEVDRIIKERKSNPKTFADRKKKTLSQSGEEWADRIKKLKIKTDDNVLQSNILGLPIAVYNTLIDGIAKSVKEGSKIADAIKEALSDGKYKGITEDQLSDHLVSSIDRSDILDNIKSISDEQKIKGLTQEAVGKGYISDLVNSYIDEGLRGKDVFDELKTDLQKNFPDISDQQIRDAYLKKGEFKLDSKDVIDKEKRDAQSELKNIAKLGGKIDDARKNIAGSKTESEKRKWTDIEKKLSKELKSELNKRNISLERGGKSETDIKKNIADAHNERMDNLIKNIDERLKNKDIPDEESKSLNNLKNKIELSKVDPKTSEKIDRALMKAETSLRNEAINVVGDKDLFDQVNSSLASLKKDMDNGIQDILMDRYKKQLQTKIDQSNQKIESGEYDDEPKPLRNKVDGETIRLEMEQRKIDAKYRRLKYLAEQKNKKGWEKAIGLGQSFLVDELIGGMNTAGVVLTSGLTKQPFNTLTEFLGTPAHWMFPELSKAAGAETAFSLKKEQNRYLAHYSAMGEKGLERRFDKAQDNLDKSTNDYNNEKKLYGDAKKGTPEYKKLINAKNKQLDALIAHQSLFIYKWLGTNAWKDAGDVFTKGASQLDELLGLHQKVGWKDMTNLEKTQFTMGVMGALHGTFKNFSARAEFAASFTGRLQNKAARGIDISEPDEILKTVNESYINYLMGKYQEDNYATTLMNRVGKLLEDVGTEPSRYGADRRPKNENLGKVAHAVYRGKFPIIRTGVNIAREAIQEYMLGSLLGGASHGRVVVKGILHGIKESEPIKESIKNEISKMSPDKIDLIFRCYRKGGLGLVMGALAALGYVKFGGFYNQDDSHRRGAELHQGEVELFGHKFDHKSLVAKAFEHTAATMPSLMVGNTHQVYERKFARGVDRGDAYKAASDAVKSDFVGAMNLIPALNTGIGNPLTSPSVPYGRFVGDISQYFDRDANGNLVKRDNTTWWNRLRINTGFRKFVPIKTGKGSSEGGGASQAFGM